MTTRDPKHMRVAFVGRRTGFNGGFIRWLDEHYTLVGVYFIEEDWPEAAARAREVRRRVKRLGVLRVVDELLFLSYYVLRFGKEERRLWDAGFPDAFLSVPETTAPTHSCDDIHSRRWRAELTAAAPDVVFATCGRTIFRRRFFGIPRYGTFVLHEGITPEYRGLHTAGWALLNSEPQYVGYTLLKVDDGIDTGSVLCQGAFADAEMYGFHWRFLGHRALLDGLPHMKESLDGLHENDGDFEPVSQNDRTSHNYSWIRLTQYVARRLSAMSRRRR
ncbi:hypothetical protein HOK31_24695 [Candidatus Poribacteria bacterium]|jgi:hypothetical protein|nr:hypothetical protein [Candidatus Poribacteria bacterium]MBT7101427.1 hypothetical protein [Candidatus Poribacteria bacterium]MBT7808757.1 hypothetical protein [Candidatus Poribacteria bacterium]